MLGVGFVGASAEPSGKESGPHAGGGSGGGTDPTRPIIVQPLGTRKMIERLIDLREKADRNPTGNAFWSEAQAGYYRTELAHEFDPRKKLGLYPKLAQQLLHAGKNEEALVEMDQLVKELAALGMRLKPDYQALLDLQRATAHLRIGEQENCIVNHASESCLFPIRGGGIHRLPRGSRAAIAVLTGILGENADDLAARWLLNVAAMTLGEYPEKLAPAWLIPPSVFASGFDIKRFPEVAGPAGLDVVDLAGGSLVEDFDGDGLLDLMVSAWGLTGQLRYFHNTGDGKFEERTEEAGLTGLVSGLNMMQTDYNNDGWLDVFILRGAWLGAAGHYPNSLLRNNGDGTFADVTEEANLLSFHPTQTAAWFDYNGDGWLDVFIGNESSKSEPNPCELYRNDGDGTFTEVGEETGVAAVQFVKGVASADYNQDGRPDLYLSIRGGANVLYRNDGPQGDGKGARSKWAFTDVAKEAGVTEPWASFPTWFWDFDNDGWQDLMVTGYSVSGVAEVAADYLGLPHAGEKARLYRNNQDGTFADVTAAAGLAKVLHAMGANFGDLDNDGWLDFYVATGDPALDTLIPNRMFRGDGGHRFEEVTTSGGFGHLQKGHGVSFADLDNDGDQDVHVVMGGAYSGDIARNALFLNPGHGNHWLTLKLEGVATNRAALGARLRVILNTAEGERSIYRTVGSGGSFGASPLRQEIGLGKATRIRAVEILWPTTGKTQTVSGLKPDRFYTIREDRRAAVESKPMRFTLAVPTDASHEAVPAALKAAE